jgi:hypothetical protein
MLYLTKAKARVKKPDDEGSISTVGADTSMGGITWERSIVPFLKEGKALLRDVLSNKKQFKALYDSERAADQRKLKTLTERLLKTVAPLVKKHQKTIDWIRAYAEQAGSHEINREVRDLMEGLAQYPTATYGPEHLEMEMGVSGDAGGVLSNIFSGKGAVVWEIYLENAFTNELSHEARVAQQLTKNLAKGVKPVKEEDIQRMEKEGLTLYQAKIGVHDPYKHKGTPPLTDQDIDDLAPGLLKDVQAFTKRYATVIADFTDTLDKNKKRITNLDPKFYVDYLRKLQSYDLDMAKEDLKFGPTNVFTHLFGDFITSSSPWKGLLFGMKSSIPGAIL